MPTDATWEKPYLETLPSAPEPAAKTMQWATFLGSRFGANGALNALQFYESLGWISAEVRNELHAYIRGLNPDELNEEDDMADNTHLEEFEDSPFAVHLASLRYVSEIVGDDFRRETINVDVADQLSEPEQEVLDSIELLC